MIIFIFYTFKMALIDADDDCDYDNDEGDDDLASPS